MRLTILLAAALLALPSPLPAQRGGQLEIALQTRGGAESNGPLVRTSGMIADREMRGLLRSGFPARLHFRVELWSEEGWFNSLERSVEWDIVIRQDPLDGSLRAVRIVSGDTLASSRRFRTAEDLEEWLAFPYRVPLSASGRRGRHYYNAVLDVEVLSLSDLDEVDRWLRGEVRPAIRGDRNPTTALTRGIRTLMVRLLGGERRHYEARSASFRP